MRKVLGAVVLISLLPVLSLSAAGKAFARPNPDALKLGQTTFAEVVRLMGQSGKEGMAVVNGRNIKSLTYVYAVALGGEALEKGVIPARALVYFFENDTLVGQSFNSSFKSDNTNFDDQKISSISKGKTTRAEVIGLLGNPAATYISPLVKDPSQEAIGYGYQATRGGVFRAMKTFNKNLKITFDANGVVSDIDYFSSGDR